MDKKDINYEAYVAGLVARAREAQKVANGYDQARVDELTAAVAWAACNEEFRMKAAEMLVEESKIGVVQDKFNKIRNKALGVYRDMKGEKSVGIIETDVDHGLVKYIKPMGVIGALIPITNGEATPIVKTLWALKSRNAIIMAPHPGGRKTCLFVVNYIREVLKKYGAPEDLVMTIEPEYVAVECSGQLMKQVDFVVATGGTPDGPCRLFLRHPGDRRRYRQRHHLHRRVGRPQGRRLQDPPVEDVRQRLQLLLREQRGGPREGL